MATPEEIEERRRQAAETLALLEASEAERRLPTASDSSLIAYDIINGEVFPIFGGLEDTPSLALTEQEITTTPPEVRVRVIEQRRVMQVRDKAQQDKNFLTKGVEAVGEFLGATKEGFEVIAEEEIIPFDPNSFVIRDIRAAKKRALEQGDPMSVAIADASLQIIRGGLASVDYLVRGLAGILNGLGEGLETIGGDKRSFLSAVEFLAIQSGVGGPPIKAGLGGIKVALAARAAGRLVKKGGTTIMDIGAGIRVAIRETKTFQKIKARQARKEVEKITAGKKVEDLSEQALDDLANIKDGPTRQLAFEEKFSRFRETIRDNGAPTQAEIEAAFEAQLREAFAGSENIEALVVQGMRQFKVLDRSVKAEAFGQKVSTTELLDPTTDINAITRGIASDVMRSKKVTYDPTRGWQDQFIELIQSDPQLMASVFNRLASLGVTPVEFLEGFFPKLSEAGAVLQKGAAIADKIKTGMIVAANPEQFTLINTLLGLGGRPSSGARFSNFWDGSTTLMRGSFTSAFSTASRNFATVQTLTLPGDALVQMLNNNIRRAFEAAAPKTRFSFLGKERSLFTEDVLKPGFAKANEVQALEIYAKLVGSTFGTKARKSNFQFVQQALLEGGFLAERNELFMQFASDISLRAGGPIRTKVNQYVSIINIANRAQDVVVRSAIMAARMEARLKKAGFTMEEALNNPSIYNQVFTHDAIRTMVDEALNLTFAAPARTFGVLGRTFIKAVNVLGPLAVADLPFPRFLVNGIQFGINHSPLVLARFASKAERAAFRAGDPTRISQFIVGMGVYLAASKLYERYNKGNKWYQLELDDGTIFDMRAFLVGVGGMFWFLDLDRRRKDGTLQEISPEDVIEGILATRVGRVEGFDAYNAVARRFANVDENDPEKTDRAIQELVGSFTKALGRPFKTLSDLVALAGNEEELDVKSTVDHPMIGPLIKEIPLVNEILKDAPSPTRSGPIKVARSPLSALFGIPLRDPKNLVEKEIDRLDIPGRNVRFSSVDPILDEALNRELGPAMEEIVIPALKQGMLKKLSLPFQSKTLKGYIRLAKAKAMGVVLGRSALEGASEEDVELGRRMRRMRLRELSLDDRRILQDALPELTNRMLNLMILVDATSLDSPSIPETDRRIFLRQLNREDQ